jgi:hypothetical protein
MTTPVLAMPDFSKPFCIETDASNRGVGAVLLQQGHPLAFISKPFGPHTQGLSTYEKEYMAILAAIEHWRSYLHSLFGWLVADGWCWFILREKYCWLVTDG